MTGTFRLASYNIRKAVGLDWRRRPERILHVLDEIAPDVAVLQEADKRLGSRPAALPFSMIAQHGRFMPLDPGPGPSLGWHGNAILLGAGFTGRVEGRLDLPGIEPRGAFLARVEGPPGPFLLVATHLGLDRASRRRQVAAILDAAPEGLPVVVAGDLNEPRPALLVAKGRRFRVVTPGPTFHAARPVIAFDHLLLGHGARAAAQGVHASPLARVASDHLPIWAEIRLVPRGPSG
jgi:endonuclease/exonuclease/phosphatase family metal-dependent hydrolase